MKLYSRPLSGHAHRVRLFLSLLGIEHSLIEVDLADHDWIVAGPHPTLADVALYSYFAQAPEGNVDLAGYPRINRWLVRIEALPGFVPFQKTPAGLAAIA